jgi:Mechanosensitive ion channel, conserved TM helix
VEQFKNGLGDAWASVATFLPKLIGFLIILIIGYFVAKAIAKVVDGILERVGFDRMVEKGGVGKALASSRFDASDIIGKLVFYALFLFVLQLAFGVFGPNPVSDLIKGVIAYLPNVLVAIIIIVIGAAIAAAVKEIVDAALGGLSYGKALGIIASSAILVIAIFAALDQLQIAPAIVRGLFYALLAILVGSSVVAIGGGGIKTMSRYWERAAERAEAETGKVKQEAQGAGERVSQRAEERKQQIQGGGTSSTRA